ncbi:MAG TPA: rhomboid family intramembrane serine protease [Pirellulaceae bacterium]
MGIYDRPYYRDEEGTGGWRGPRSVVTALILINVGIAILDLFTAPVAKANGVGHWLSETMALPSTALQRPWELWKLLTAGFAHESFSQHNGMMHVLLNMYGLWLFGRGVESRLGSREFLRLYLGLVVLANLVWLLLHAALQGDGALLLGASGAVTGITVLFILYVPHQRFLMLFFPAPVPAWVLGILIVGMDVLGAIGLSGQGNGNVAFSVHLAGAALAYLYYRSGLRLSDVRPKWLTWKRWTRPRLRVHHEGNPSDDLERTADRILAKMHEQGADSLTAEERRILSDYSRRIRQKLS